MATSVCSKPKRVLSNQKLTKIGFLFILKLRQINDPFLFSLVFVRTTEPFFTRFLSCCIAVISVLVLGSA